MERLNQLNRIIGENRFTHAELPLDEEKRGKRQSGSLTGSERSSYIRATKPDRGQVRQKVIECQQAFPA
jgi:hypothetical protein